MIEHSEGVALLHTGKASGVLKLGQPIDETKMLNIFVLLRRDPCFTKPKSKRAAKVQVAKKKEATIKMQTENEDYSCDDSDSGDMSGEDTFEFNSNKVNPTMVAQTFQNYVSALKWWVKYENSEYSKEPGVFSKTLDSSLQDFVKSYKREVKSKESTGIMKQSKKAGLRPFSQAGYEIIAQAFMGMGGEREIKRKYTKQESRFKMGSFCQAYFKLSVNTFGRSDNMARLYTEHISWNNDHLEISLIQRFLSFRCYYLKCDERKQLSVFNRTCRGGCLVSAR